jgi:hypothetical protein
MIGLHAAHRKSVNSGELAYAAHLGDETVLRPHIIGDGDERGIVRRLGRTGGFPVREHADGYDAPARGIENALRTDQPGHVLKTRGIAAGKENEIVVPVVECAKALPGEVSVAYHAAFLHGKIAECEAARVGLPVHGSFPRFSLRPP